MEDSKKHMHDDRMISCLNGRYPPRSLLRGALQQERTKQAPANPNRDRKLHAFRFVPGGATFSSAGIGQLPPWDVVCSRPIFHTLRRAKIGDSVEGPQANKRSILAQPTHHSDAMG
jgi:hypothetical protein